VTENKKKLEAEEASRLKSKLVSIVSHELRTPIIVIKNALGIVLQHSSLTLLPEMRALIGSVLQNTERLIRLINDTLDLGKIEANKFTLHKKIQPLLPLLEQVVKDYQLFANEFNVRLQLGPVIRNAIADVDTDKWIQIMSNLISNAIKFSGKNTVVTVSLKRRKGSIYLIVQDQGSGIPSEIQSSIYMPFVHSSPAIHPHKGAGLGLSITKSLVELHGGTIHFETSLKGTKFFVTLPDQTITDPAIKATSGKRVLIVDDDPDLLRLYDILLTSTQYTVLTMHSGKEALQWMVKERPDLVITDIHFPEENVIDFINTIKANKKIKSIPVAVFSSHYLKEEEKACYEAGAVRVFIKPYDPQIFLNIVDELLGTIREPQLLQIDSSQELEKLVDETLLKSKD
jgi:CheY-like chemotaxis protein